LKRVLSFIFSVATVLALYAVPFSATADDDGINDNYKGTTLRVFNWGEYISDGEDDTLDVITEFENETGIDVEYITYANNEELYASMENGGITYDVIVPSDYMFERLLAEGYLQKIDFANIPNYKYIADRYKGVFEFDPGDEYSVPYTVGMVGVIYNTTMVTETPKNWDILWSEDYKGEILMFNNPRDAFAIAQFKAGISINTNDPTDWEIASEELKAQKKVLKRYVDDEIFDIMEEGDAALAPYYAGDFFTMKENNEDLEFFYPRNDNGELITNQFIDVMCIPKASKNKAAAEMFINYMLRPDIALANAEYICYASPNTAVIENEEYSFSKANDPYAYGILYPDEFADFDKKLMFRHLDENIINIMNDQWAFIKAYGVNAVAIHIVSGAILLALIVLVVIKLQNKKKRSLGDEYYSLASAGK